jgi:hypothetical protein
MNYKVLERFNGKVCTVFTVGINRDFKQENPKTYPKPLYVYFMGAVEFVCEEGIMLQQVTTGLSTFVFMNNIVSISEEEILDPENEQDAQVIEKYKTEAEEARKQYANKTPISEVNPDSSPYVDVDSIENLSEMVKKDLNQ